jgi:lysophospholipase L1-like esterase
MRLRIITACLIAAAALLALSACGSDEPLKVGRMVALGDSDPAASGLTGNDPSTHPLCYRTLHGYPRIASRKLGATEYVDATCASATIPDLSSNQQLNGVSINDPQLNSLDGTESIVTLTIGDNDAGITEVWTNCLQSDWYPSATPCKDHFGADGLKAKADALAAPLAKLLDEIHKRSPKAKIYLVGYQRLLPDDVSSCQGKINVTPADAAMVTAWQKQVADVQQRAAAAHEATFVDLNSASGPGTDACSAEATRWLNPMINPTGWKIHPTQNGQDAAAEKLVAAIKSAES